MHRGGGGTEKFTIPRANSRSKLSLAYDSREIGQRRSRLVFSSSPVGSLLPLPLPERKRLSLNYGCGGTVKFCGADKGAIQIKRSPFPTPPVLVLFTCTTLPPPPSHRWQLSLVPSLSLGVSWCTLIPLLVYFVPSLLSETAAFLLGRSASSPRLANLPAIFLMSYVRG